MDVSTTDDALILFCDVIDSSKYSAILGIEEYARQLLEFQSIFTALGKEYFPDKDDKTSFYYFVSSRGDEGIIFCVDFEYPPQELVYKAVKFSFELKGRIELKNATANKGLGFVPSPMDVGIGIHYGKVAILADREKNADSVIQKIEGYSINYAKRIESCSRVGKHSKIFLSKKAATLLDEDPIIFEKYSLPLKGIDDQSDVYEIRSIYLEDFPLNYDHNEKFIEYYTDGDSVRYLDYLNKPWLKGLVLSVLDTRLKKVPEKLRDTYAKKISEIVWDKPLESDPILLFRRACECEERAKYSRSVTYLKDILKNSPFFLKARIKLIDVCYEMVKVNSGISHEIIFVRDTAEEMLEKYDTCLLPTEKERLENIIKQIKLD